MERDRSKKIAIRCAISQKKIVEEQLDVILVEKDRYNFVISQPTTHPLPKSWRVQSTSSIDLEEVHGREPNREILVSKLRPDDGILEELVLHILAVGEVGIVGKTTLAQMIPLMWQPLQEELLRGKGFFLSWTMFGQKTIPCGNP
ncbi:hypothetical protein ACS0TY_011469 [Phlomoides rotata]